MATAGIFALEVMTPQGIAESTLYSLVVLLALQVPAARFVTGVATLCSFLTLVGFLVSPASTEPWKSMVNRGFALLGIWLVTLLGLQRQKVERELQRIAAEREAALARALNQFIPICAWCKKVNNAQDSWESLESFIASKTASTFTHGICPDCYREVSREQ